MKDHNGNEVPVQYVPKLDKERDAFARKFLKQAEALSSKLSELKAEIFKEGDAIWDKMKGDADVNTGEKNFSITSFDKQIKIEFVQAERIEFDDNINLAKAKIDQFLSDKMKASDADISQLVKLAFETRKGQLDTKKVLALFKLKITAQLWTEAMELIKKSIDRNNSKRYVRLWKKNEQGEYRAVEMNFSAV